jgi:DNA invertase Pin-like site-specific DNA recombinase
MSEPQQRTMQTTHRQVPTPRFFTAPPLDDKLKEIFEQFKQSDEKRKKKRKVVMTRYAAYIRISSEEQVGNYSVDAQRRAIQTWVQGQDGQLVQVYIDEAQSGRTASRPAFQQMRQDARKGKFDALVVHKFDRFARNRTDALAIKSLLRYDYNIKVFSVTEPSEDSDGPIGALIEGIMECVAEWYSKNLASEVSKGRHEKFMQGYHNNQPPFGLMRDGKRLIPNPAELPGLLLAFKAYATGKYSFTGIAQLLNQHGYKSTSGRLFTKDAVREILQNQIYIGKVRYQPTRYNSDRTRDWSVPVEWIDGQHESVIPLELWGRAEEARRNGLFTGKLHQHILHTSCAVLFTVITVRLILSPTQPSLHGERCIAQIMARVPFIAVALDTQVLNVRSREFIWAQLMNRSSPFFQISSRQRIGVTASLRQ